MSGCGNVIRSCRKVVLTVTTYLSTRKIEKLIEATASPINISEASLSKLETNTSPSLHNYTHSILHTIHNHSVLYGIPKYMTLHTSSLAHMCTHS